MLGGLLDFLLPRRCCVCNVLIDGDGGLASFFCGSCGVRLADAAAGRCTRCSAPLGPADAQTGRCVSCRTLPLGFKRSYAAADYEGLLRELILALKFEHRCELAHPLASILYNRIADHDGAPAWDGVVPVPTWRTRRIVRRYSAVDLVSQHVARMLGVRSLGLLVFARHVAPQRGLGRTARFKNVKGAFRVARPGLARGRKLLLIDDVMTTGATASECARTLKRAGAARVEVAVIAKTNLLARG